MTELAKVPPQLWRVVSEIVDASVASQHFGKLSPTAVTELKARIKDDFDAGEVGLGIQKLLNATPTRRARRAVADLLDSALVSLGVDTAAAAANWQVVLEQLSKAPGLDGLGAPNLRASPIRDAFRGISIRFDQDVRSKLRLTSLELARLDAALKKAAGSEQPITSLQALEKKLEVSKLPDATLMGFVSGYRKGEAWTDLIRIYEAAPADFRRHPSAIREYALALLQTGHADRAHDALRAAVEAGDRSTGTLGLFGRVLKDRYDAAKAAGDEGAKKYLSGAARTYTSAFRRAPSELYPGVALPVLLEERGNLSEAKRVARLIFTNAERRASFGERHYWDAAAALEMALVLEQPGDAKKWLGRALDSESERWMRKSTITNLTRLEGVRQAAKLPTTAIRAAIEALTEASGVPSYSGHDNSRSEQLSNVLNTTYRMGGRTAKWLSGNYSYEGIAHDVRVTPADVAYFDRVLSASGISKLRNPLQASAAMDQLIRAQFNTVEMENRKSPLHQRYDRVMPGLAKLMAATASNSQTNVSADWINRLADCRQHAPAKLLLWEAWKTGRTDSLLNQIDAADHSGDSAKLAKLKLELSALNAWELRIMDAEIVDAKSGQPIEEHTMTLLVRRKGAAPGEAMGELDELRLADSFYQTVFALGQGVVTPSTKDGRLWIDVPTKGSDGRAIAIRPAPYSFDRAAPSVDFGQLDFRGLQVASPGWEKGISVQGIDLKYLHDFAARPSTNDGPLA